MSTFKLSVLKSFQGAVKTFRVFPVAIASAVAFSIVTMIRIQLDWPQQEEFNFLFNCLHLAFATSTAFGLLAITVAQSRYNNKKAFLTANIFGVAAALITFILLYSFGGVEQEMVKSNLTNVTVLAATRVTSVIVISFIGFIFFAGYPKERSDFSSALFMFQKAFFIAMLYGMVIMGGSSGVAGAVQSLLYSDMSSKVYMYLGTVAGFLAFTIFVGYFPDFRKGEVDKHREVAQKQPRFIEILFEYIMIPIILALTAVLLMWVGKTIVTGSWPEFRNVSGIVISYSFGGIWLHLMTTRYESGLSKFYRKIYPITALVILFFGLWSLVLQLNEVGLKTQEYYFTLTLVLAVSSAVLLIVLRAEAHSKIALLICIVVIISVTPFIGYHALPVGIQVNRLENLLTDNGMLKDDQLVPAVVEPEQDIRESITDAVEYLAYTEDGKLPDWFDKRLIERDVFKSKLGFEQTWPEYEDFYDDRYEDALGAFLMLPAIAIDISDYDWVVYLGDDERGRDAGGLVNIDGENGSYIIDWFYDIQTNIPTLKILLDDSVILEHDMKEYLDNLASEFQRGKEEFSSETYEDMSLVLETNEIVVMVVFNHIDIQVDPRYDNIYYYLDLKGIYFKEKH